MEYAHAHVGESFAFCIIHVCYISDMMMTHAHARARVRSRARTHTPLHTFSTFGRSALTTSQAPSSNTTPFFVFVFLVVSAPMRNGQGGVIREYSEIVHVGCWEVHCTHCVLLLQYTVNIVFSYYSTLYTLCSLYTQRSLTTVQCSNSSWH